MTIDDLIKRKISNYIKLDISNKPKLLFRLIVDGENTRLWSAGQYVIIERASGIEELYKKKPLNQLKFDF